jgi:hypothetical protein
LTIFAELEMIDAKLSAANVALLHLSPRILEELDIIARTRDRDCH